MLNGGLKLKCIGLEMEVILRLAREDDLRKLEWDGQYSQFRHSIEDAYREQLAGRRLLLLADLNGSPIGQIFIVVKEKRFLFARDHRRGYFYSFRVMEAFRGQGIGTKLIQEAENLLVQHGRHVATIAVAQANPDARRLYERNGYRVYAEDEGHWSYVDLEGNVVHMHEPAWLLEKRLVPSR
jgi:ribosomal protein S18 acetylase RimI-like enzyme